MSWIEWTNETFRGLNLRNLKVDHAFLNITNHVGKEVFLYSLSEECEKCPFSKHKNISHLKEIVKIDTTRSLELKVFHEVVGKYAFDNQTAMCHVNTNMGQFGVYDLIIRPTECEFLVAKDPVNIYLPLLVNFFILIGIYGIIKLFNYLYEKYCPARRNVSSSISNTPDDPPSEQSEVKPAKKRLKSVDVFRGISITLMIFVNYGGGHYWFIEHAVWNGLHLADVVFPWFLFLMGTCIPMSIKSQLNRSVTKSEIIKKVIERSAKLFFIGLCLNTINGTTFGNIRIFGVLQRFGISYLFVSLVHLFLNVPTVVAETRFQKVFLDIKILFKQWLIILGVLILHLLNLYFFPVSGCESGYFGPGGKHDYLKHFNCTGGSTGYLDRLIIGDSHVYQWAKIKNVYESLSFDPEGFIGCWISIVHTFIGLQCGMTLIVYPTVKERIRRWLCWAVVLGLLTGILTKFSKNDGWIPINKNLWSLTFVTGTCSLAFLVLIICYILVDVKKVWSGSPFFFPGMNSILLYIGHSVFHHMFPFRMFPSNYRTHFLLTLENLYGTGVWIFISYRLYKAKKFYNL